MERSDKNLYFFEISTGKSLCRILCRSFRAAGTCFRFSESLVPLPARIEWECRIEYLSKYSIRIWHDFWISKIMSRRARFSNAFQIGIRKPFLQRIDTELSVIIRKSMVFRNSQNALYLMLYYSHYSLRKRWLDRYWAFHIYQHRFLLAGRIGVMNCYEWVLFLFHFFLVMILSSLHKHHPILHIVLFLETYLSILKIC